MDKLLLLGTTWASRALIRYAKSIGVHTITTDARDPSLSVGKLESDESWMINTADVDALEKKCREERITGICCGVSEFNIERMQELCARLGLKSYCTPDAWHYSRDKDDFKKLCRRLGAPVATDYFLSDALTDDELASVKLPVVVKPVDLAGNRGVSYCHTISEVAEAYRYARSLSKSNKIVVERMLHGEEWYSMYAVANGEVSLLSLNAMYSEPGEPKNIYTVTTTVSDHVEQFIREVNPIIEKVLKEVGCTDGMAWVQVMLDEDGHFYIIEMGYRMDGEMMFIPCKEVCNFDMIKWYVETALGKEHSPADLPAPQQRAYTKCACSMELFTNKGGIVTDLGQFAELERMPGLYVENLKHIGDKIDPYRPVAVITFTEANCDAMCRRIAQVNEMARMINERGEDMIVKYTNFDYLKHIYAEGLAGR